MENGKEVRRGKGKENRKGKRMGKCIKVRTWILLLYPFFSISISC